MPLFILQNQHDQFLTRDGEWSAGGDTNQLFSSKHYDGALNQLIEMNAKDHTLRGMVVACELDNRGRPVLSEVTKASADKNPDIGIDETDNLAPIESESDQEEIAIDGMDSEPETRTETDLTNDNIPA